MQRIAPPLIRVAGSPAQRGAAIGAACSSQIGAAAELYARLFRLAEAELARRGAYFAEIIREFRPDFAIEIAACAHAANVPEYRLFAMNARSELLAMLGVPECTAVSFPRAGLLGQTWDWLDAFEDLFVVVLHDTQDAGRVLTVTEAGMLAKIGLNASGVGVCLNFLMPGRTSASGVPIHSFLRAALECRSWDEVCTLSHERADGIVGNVMVASAAGQLLNVEGAPDRAHRTTPQCDAFVHTNHYLQVDLTGPMDLISNSVGRLEAARTLIEREGRELTHLKQILSDRDVGPILVPYTPHMGLRVGTVCTVLMELGAGRLHVRKGPDADAPFATYDVEGTTS